MKMNGISMREKVIENGEKIERMGRKYREREKHIKREERENRENSLKLCPMIKR